MSDLEFGEVTVYTGRPAFQGSTLHTWIGFKRFMYLAEEAVLEFFRQRDWGPHRLYQEYGLCLEVVDSAVRVFQPLHIDDQVRVEVRAKERPPTPNGNEGKELALAVQFFVERDGKKIKPLSGQVKVLLRRAGNDVVGAGWPPALVPYVCDEINRTATSTNVVALKPVDMTSDEGVRRQLTVAEANAFIWKGHIPYYYCHYWDRIQHSGYVAFLEGIVPLFLAERGISIRTMLETRGWIPVVSSAQVEILREARMEETLYVVYTVEEIFKELTYTARMDCFVPREGSLLPTATGRIVHGYAQVRGRQEWGLARLDTPTLTALQGDKR
ncbi:MAG: hypothetical protein L0332_23900 [Chloroflexi bacterium]|nr:hypothetical protein [Chloroflexota bacterium]